MNQEQRLSAQAYGSRAHWHTTSLALSVSELALAAKAEAGIPLACRGR